MKKEKCRAPGRCARFVFVLLAAVSFLTLKPVLARGETSFTSSELNKAVTKEGNVERTDYTDAEGTVRFASDKGYATLVKTRNGDTVLEEYFGEDGEPAVQSQGYCGILREYNEQGQNTRITYLGADGAPVMVKNNYAGMERTFYEDGRVRTEMYFDIEGKPVRRRSQAFGTYKEYNEQGRNTLIVYVDQDGNPMTIAAGYAILRRTYYEEGSARGKVEREFYFDPEDRPKALSHGQYGVYREYDGQGRNDAITYLGPDGEKIVGREGYTTLRKTFYPNNSLRTEMYFGPDGKPARLAEGQCGILKEKGRTIYLDAQGNRMFNLRNFLYAHPRSVIFFAFAAALAAVFAGKRTGAVLTALYLAFIVYMTLMYRAEGESRARFELFWSYRQFFDSAILRLEILNNIWLFIPMGAMLSQFMRGWKAVLCALLCSAAVEIVQYYTGLGLCELDDVVSNTLGAATGAVLAAGINRIRHRKQPGLEKA